MSNPTKAQIQAAIARGNEVARTAPHASVVRFDVATRRIVVTLANGTELLVPVHLLEGLAEATDDQIAEVELLGDGFGLHWESLDVDLTVPGLVMGIFGTAAWMARFSGSGGATDEASKITIFAPEGIPESFEVVREPGESDEAYEQDKALIDRIIKAATARGGEGE
jgi:hypothetical protein